MAILIARYILFTVGPLQMLVPFLFPLLTVNTLFLSLAQIPLSTLLHDPMAS